MDLVILLAQQAQDGGNSVLSGAFRGAIFGGVIGGLVGLLIWGVRKLGGSPARAYDVTGNPLAEQPDCVYQPKGWGAVPPVPGEFQPPC